MNQNLTAATDTKSFFSHRKRGPAIRNLDVTLCMIRSCEIELASTDVSWRVDMTTQIVFDFNREISSVDGEIVTMPNEKGESGTWGKVDIVASNKLSVARKLT